MSAHRLSRRRVLAGLAGSAAMGGVVPRIASAQAGAPVELAVDHRTIEVNGRPGHLLGILQPSGKQGLATEVGNAFRVHLVNRLDTPTTVHWHGLTPPSDQDGVPELSQPPIPAGASHDYDFPLKHSGTYWMHSHVGYQEQLMYAPLIIADPADRGRDEQEIVMLLADFSFKPPEELAAALRESGGMAGMKMGSGNTAGMSGMSGMGNMQGMSHASGTAAGAEPDVNDIDYDAYLANDRALGDPDVIRVERGGRVRLRVINSASATAFHLDLGRLTGELIAVDGQPVRALRASRFPLSMAQRIDVRLQLPSGGGTYPILALREGARERAGVVLATADAAVSRIATLSAKPSPVLDLILERKLTGTEPLAPREADRIHDVRLAGDMTSYVWTINERIYSEHEPLMVKSGERVELVIRNLSMMSHPMHLHGHSFQVVAIGGKRFAGARRDTVLVPAMASVTVAFDADNPGRWAFHCHNLYHMEAGMMTEVKYQA
ncbi:MAG TPA: multicopper oxidase family protein [Stellaceae bacterium]|nr:multicopper oxidase family protein [Stellaceae bacterium]